MELRTRVRSVDVFFLVDNSASMDPIILTLRDTMSTVLLPGIRAAIGPYSDVRFGIGSFDSLPDGVDGTPGDYDLWVRQPITTPDRDGDARVLTALAAMRTITTDTSGGNSGGDEPENQLIAAWHLISGGGSILFPPLVGGEIEAARASVHGGPSRARGTRGAGWVPTMDPALDCGAAAGDPVYGWGCFRTGRIPIVVLFSDATWYNMPGTRGLSAAPSYQTMVDAMVSRSVLLLPIDVGRSGATRAAAITLALATHTVDSSGRPLVYTDPGGGPAGIGAVVDAVAAAASQTRQDVTTSLAPDPAEGRLDPSHDTSDFVTTVRPDHADPGAPEGFEHVDATTFFEVRPSTLVAFDVDFYNDFHRNPTAAPQVFRTTLDVLGRARNVLARRDLYVIVPSECR